MTIMQRICTYRSHQK